MNQPPAPLVGAVPVQFERDGVDLQVVGRLDVLADAVDGRIQPAPGVVALPAVTEDVAVVVTEPPAELAPVVLVLLEGGLALLLV